MITWLDKLQGDMQVPSIDGHILLTQVVRWVGKLGRDVGMWLETIQKLQLTYIRQYKVGFLSRGYVGRRKPSLT